MKNLFPLTGLILVFLGFLWACTDQFGFSPFEADVEGALRNTTERNLKRISEIDTSLTRPFKVAIISDSHYHFNDLADAVNDINEKDDYSFVIMTGDMSDNGLLAEFEIFHSIMSRCRIPYVTVIGNHDHLSNGAVIYKQMFGPLNYIFTFHHVKFILWDNTVWESEKEPDFDWLVNSIEHRDDAQLSFPYHHIIPVSHIPPFDAQFDANRDKYLSLLSKNAITLSVHGHKHEFEHDLYRDEIRVMTVGSPQNRNYAELVISRDGIIVNKIDF
jgi:predicted phosphodiesterase